MTPEVAVQAGRAIVYYLREQNSVDRPKIVIGRDTRISGPMLASAVMAGICSMGGDVIDAGILPTPGVAYLTRSEEAHAGIVISASHNPFQDNGIKLFRGDGYKLSDAQEAELENLILNHDLQRSAENIHNTGRIQTLAYSSLNMVFKGANISAIIRMQDAKAGSGLLQRGYIHYCPGTFHLSGLFDKGPFQSTRW